MSANGKRKPRGTTTQRGYGTPHQRRRRQVAQHVASGHAVCARCGQPIKPGEPWDLGHRDGSGKMVYSGPEHARCNRATATHKRQQRDTDPLHDHHGLRWSRNWNDPEPPPPGTHIVGMGFIAVADTSAADY
jgi:hypothetical protein